MRGGYDLLNVDKRASEIRLARIWRAGVKKVWPGEPNIPRDVVPLTPKSDVNMRPAG